MQLCLLVEAKPAVLSGKLKRPLICPLMLMSFKSLLAIMLLNRFI
ncbi:hypothetical protein AB3S75_041071 [Citrus x aurantiifolia]